MLSTRRTALELTFFIHFFVCIAATVRFADNPCYRPIAVNIFHFEELRPVRTPTHGYCTTTLYDSWADLDAAFYQGARAVA